MAYYNFVITFVVSTLWCCVIDDNRNCYISCDPSSSSLSSHATKFNHIDLGERVPSEVFTNTVQFLNEYPSEVVVLLFEASTEKGPIVWNDLSDIMSTVDGFSDMIHVHTYGYAWPTMKSLVSQNKRIIIFYMNGGTCTNDVCPTGFYYFYNYAKETQYQSSSLSELQNYAYSCEVKYPL